jgi:hypothetical protein
VALAGSSPVTELDELHADRKVHARQSTLRSSSDKAALEYLDLCGAVPISVIKRDGMCSIRAGGDRSSAQWWGDRKKAVPVAKAARQFAGAKGNLLLWYGCN